ncbi:SRPBCC family protein [Mucilaginibacter agri]|uniref:ATPase n=1 Tax=Mucilaginibacter agri TaxID=2695265 RepID=A0A965ZIX0_9SPHI|nr:SRPBCC family protein [Mucilaginibacter agri]NCD71959.1 ATPase [Mucilaginibacter agri]
MTTLETTITILPGKQEILIEREFNAPRELVFSAFTDAELYKQWLGPKDLVTKSVISDSRSGGSYEFVHSDSAGNDYKFHGVYHEIKFPERIIKTFEFDGLPESGHVVLETSKFEALDNRRTKFTNQSIFQTVADRDGMYAADMERGIKESYERLDVLLTKFKS